MSRAQEERDLNVGGVDPETLSRLRATYPRAFDDNGKIRRDYGNITTIADEDESAMSKLWGAIHEGAAASGAYSAMQAKPLTGKKGTASSDRPQGTKGGYRDDVG